MNTKAHAVYHAERIAGIWANIGIVSLSIAIGCMLYVWWLHTQLSNCYAGGLQ